MTYCPTEAQRLIDQLGVCGCGIPQEVYKAIHQMLERANKGDEIIDSEEESPYEYYMAYMLNDKDFMEHGCSIRYCWLSNKGEQLLEALREFEKYNYDFDEIDEKHREYFGSVTMTDNEIIKVLEPFKSYFLRRKTADTDWTTTIGDVLDLINRQKAEIERLNEYISRCKSGEEYWVKCLLERPNEAIKELAERLNKEAEKVCIDREGDFVEADGEIYDTVADWCKKTSDNIVKEMTGEDK